MERILQLLPVGVEAEVYYTDATDQSVSISAGRLQGINWRNLGGYALRVIKDGRLGFATATTEDSIPWMVEAALATAELGRNISLAWPGAESDAPAVDADLEQLSTEQLTGYVEMAAQLVGSLDPGWMVRASASLRDCRTRIVNTAGGRGETRSLYLSIGTGAELVGGQDILNLHAGVSVSRLSELDLEAVVNATFGLLQQSEGVIAPLTGGLMPVLLTSKAMSSVALGPLLAAFSGRNVLQGTSPLAGQQGQQLFDEKLTLIDDATLPFAPSSAVVDDEGVPTRRFPLIENGVIKGFMYDLQTAARAGTKSTGHARKIGRTSGARLNSLPGPHISNVILQPGEYSFPELLQEMGNGVIVDQISGTPGFNPSGEFSVTIQLGYLVRQGQVVGRIKNAMLSGSVFQALRQIRAIGREAHWSGGGESGARRIPAVVVDGLRVVTK
ncbi:MAG: TldD/PmbA family protein [Bacillota bacterium]|jgi:PmbA protein